MCYRAKDHTEFTVQLSNEGFTVQTALVFFPMRWTLFISMGQKLASLSPQTHRWQLLWSMRSNSPGRMNDVNVFSTSRSNMEEMTRAGTGQCGAPGDFLNWEEANWTLHSKARIVEMDSAWGPCRRKTQWHSPNHKKILFILSDSLMNWTAPYQMEIIFFTLLLNVKRSIS